MARSSPGSNAEKINYHATKYEKTKKKTFDNIKITA